MSEQKKYTSVQVFPHPIGRWRAQVKYKDDSGKWRNKSKVLEATGIRAAKHEAEAWRDELEHTAQQEAPSADNLGDVGEFVDHYIDSLEQSQSVEKSTIAPYRFMQRHIADGLGHIQAKDLNLDAAQEWVNAMTAQYAASTVRKALNLLKAAYKDAVRRNILPYSPIDAVKAPKLRKPEPNALDRSQYERLISYLKVAANTPVNLAIKLAIFTGMREQEICGLRWRDVNLQEAELHVRNVIGRNGGKTYEKQPKTDGSRRDIPLSEELVTDLSARYDDMARECAEIGIPLTQDHYVLGRVDGKYMAPHSLWRDWKAIAKSLGLVGCEGKPPTFHDLRHTFATVAISTGSDVKSVSSILGHTNAAMTLNVYASADAEAKRRAMERTARAFSAETRRLDVHAA